MVGSSRDDELAERRAAAQGEAGNGLATAALPLEWDEADDDDDEAGPEATTIDLTERATRDDLAAWSDVLRRAPSRLARITTHHPSAAGERFRAVRAAEQQQQQEQLQQTRPTSPPDQPVADPGVADDDDFVAALTRRPRRRPGRRFRPFASSPAGPDTVSRQAAGAEEGEPSRSLRIGADLRSRVVTGVLVAAVALAFFAAGTGPAAFLCAVIIGLGVVELCAALRMYRPAVIPALVGSVALVLGTYNNGLSAYASVTALVVLGALVWYVFQVVPSPPVLGMASTLFAFGYVGGLGGFAGLILGFSDGVGILLGLVLCVVANDVTAYFAGRRFGRRPLSAISPNKTVEGLAAGMAGSVLVAMVVAGALAPWGFGSALVLGLVVAVMAPLGDICESMIKRDLGVKDLGGLLPGHGGVLDRFDAFLFCLPAVYYLARLFDLG